MSVIYEQGHGKFLLENHECIIFIVLSDQCFGFFCFVFVLFSLMLCLVQEVVLKDAPNEVKSQEGGCACWVVTQDGTRLGNVQTQTWKQKWLIYMQHAHGVLKHIISLSLRCSGWLKNRNDTGKEMKYFQLIFISWIVLLSWFGYSSLSGSIYRNVWELYRWSKRHAAQLHYIAFIKSTWADHLWCRLCLNSLTAEASCLKSAAYIRIYLADCHSTHKDVF